VNLLIAGAGGVLGRELVRQALSRGDHVAALVLRKGELRVIEHPRLRIIEADVTQPEQLAGICKGMEQVISCIGITRLKGNLTHEIVDYRGNLNLLEEAKRSGVAKFGFISPAGTERRLRPCPAHRRQIPLRTGPPPAACRGSSSAPAASSPTSPT
jgi:nucleoside-diphosphate-sugar epimerase